MKLPVRTERRGDRWVLVDAGGSPLPEQESFRDEAAAKEAAVAINAAWRRAGAERRSKGAPAVAREAALQERLREAAERRQAAAEAGDSRAWTRARARELELRGQLGKSGRTLC